MTINNTSSLENIALKFATHGPKSNRTQYWFPKSSRTQRAIVPKETLIQGGIIPHLLESGAEEFKSYVTEFSNRKVLQTGYSASLNIMKTEYEHKFCAISDVFNFLMRKRSPELQESVSRLILKSLDSEANENSHFGFAFFFKLVTCSHKTLQILIACNHHLISPFNATRAFRQLANVDKEIILPNSSFIEFIKQVVEDVDPSTHGVIFEMIIELVYSRIDSGGEHKSDLLESSETIGHACVPILEVMMNRLVRIAHATGPLKCPSLHPAISSYSYGERLQFIIESISRHIDTTSLIIRHLHAIAIANGEMKAAEIVLRFLMTMSYRKAEFMCILAAFINSTAKFFPSMVGLMFREFSSLKTLIEQSLPLDANRTQLLINLLNNFRTLLDWEISAPFDRNFFECLKIYPAEHIGSVLNRVLADTSEVVYFLQSKGDKELSIIALRMLSSLLETIRAANSSKGHGRQFLISLSEWYKLLALFSILLKYSLNLVGKEFSDGISVFEELRTNIMIFLHNNHVDMQMRPFVAVFIKFFTNACFVDSKKLFEESCIDSLETLIDENCLNNLLDMSQLEEGPAVLEGLKGLKMKDSALDMLHTGKLKKRRYITMSSLDYKSSSLTEDGKQRIFVVLDSIYDICFSGSLEVQLTNSKQLVAVLLNTVCKNSLTCDMRFDEWEIESDSIHRHVEVDRLMNQSKFCEGILRVLSESRSFAYCIPIMKSKLAVFINETKKFPEAQSCPDSLRTNLRYWIMLAHRGGILPTRLMHICDLEKFATVHETHLILLEVWKFFMHRSLTISAIDTYHSELIRGDVDEGLPNENVAIEKLNLSVFRLIIQNHLPISCSLYPKFFPAEYEFLKLSKVE
uniref:INTS5_C domain-containing protein n=1 Tax=Caenorhabditis japonica TaxID=281687 RepID=A0A8R1E980_CAEJA